LTNRTMREQFGLVAKAKDTGRGLALENLHGIRDRIIVQRAQRRQQHF